MRIAVTGSIATDHLMTFPGRFAESFVVDQLAKVSLSFLADSLDIRRGGVGGNIAFGLGVLGLRPILVGAAGEDFADYRSWLERHGVDCDSVVISAEEHTARFVCTTDESLAQIATFYPGAMRRARDIELAPVADRVGGLDLVLVGPNDPEAMLRHTDECRSRGLQFAADPSQQLAAMSGADIQRLIEGASYLFANEYEAHLITQKTGWSREELAQRVGSTVVTKGADGSTVTGPDGSQVHVPVVPADPVADPTGVGDAYRAGFLSGLAWQLAPEHCAQLGSLLATYVVESVGTQEYEHHLTGFADRLETAYGADAAAQIRPHLPAALR